MKTPVSKFTMLAFVVLLVLSGVKADSRVFIADGSSSGLPTDEMIADKVAKLAERSMNRTNQPSGKRDSFTFPNVFDVFRSIF